MYIAYSALRTTTKNGKSQLKNKQLQQRLEAYHVTCQKYNKEIAAIQKSPPDGCPCLKLKVKAKGKKHT
jgi:hypothetical protein